MTEAVAAVDPMVEEQQEQEEYPPYWVPPPSDLIFDDGDKMESFWHFGSASLLVANYVAARGGRRDDYFAAANMFLYFSAQQVRNKDYRGPDVFIVKDVDGSLYREGWVVWDEGGRYPNVVFELLSTSTEKVDLGKKKQIYEQTMRVPEYFCIAPQVERLLGWRLTEGVYETIPPDERGWLWSKELELWIGPWHGAYLGEEHTWTRFYTASGDLVLLPDEAAEQRAEVAEQRMEAQRQRAEEERQRAEEERQRAEEERQRAEEERQRADALASRLAELEAELRRLREAE